MKNYFLPLIALICFPIAAFPATTHYVNLNCTNPVSPYCDWSTAATNIQDAVDASTDGDVVLVTNGIYAEVNNLHLAINKAITVQSVNGPDATTIPGSTNAFNRNNGGCVYLMNGATLIGFTLTDGITESYGGGVWCESASAVISNCILTHCQAYYGGGAYGGTLANCIISNNLAVYGGGAYSNVLINCVLIANTATSSPPYNTYGGGACNSSLTHCMVISNSAYAGGGVCEGANIDYRGSGVYSTLDNCLLVGNSAQGGGAVYANYPIPTILNNCTICGNSSATYGGGLAGGDFAISFIYATNCIIWGNSAMLMLYSNVYYDFEGALDHCCTAPLPTSGVGNITNDPLFVNPAAGDFHLQSTSPCINAGNNAFVTGTNDLNGNSRIVGGTVDIGCYEYQSPSSAISYAYLQQYGLPTDGSADYTNYNGTTFNVYQDWIAGLNPLDPNSVLAMSAPATATNSAGITVTWQSVNTRTYFLQRSTNLAAQPAFSSIQSNIVGQAGTTSYTDSSATNSISYFYRVGVQ